MNNHSVFTVVKGMIVGGTMLVPGVSGGSMAMILGIYDRLISSVSSFMKNKKENLIFLALFCLGGGLGMILFARPLLGLIERFPMPMMYFFLGAVAGGVPMIYKESGLKRLDYKVVLYPVIGILLVAGLSLLPAGLFGSHWPGLRWDCWRCSPWGGFPWALSSRRWGRG